MSFTAVLSLVLVVLKLYGLASISWLTILAIFLSPLIVGIVFAIIVEVLERITR
jgi:hypothetical protein